MQAAGYDVTREYYINDAGKQIDNLALSLKARYHQAFGIEKPYLKMVITVKMLRKSLKRLKKKSAIVT